MEIRTMKKIILSILVLYCGMFLLNSCNQDLLEVEQHGALNPDSYYANASDADANQLIAAIYTTMYGRTNNNVTPGDDGVTRTANTNVNSQNAGSNGDFTALYRVNYLCNLIIENLTPDTEIKKQVIGEAYFWRAYAYIDLIMGWGTPPLVDHVLGPDELQPTNGTPAELWAYVESSLAEAISMLPAKPGLGQQEAIGGRVTKGAATAVLGEAQLYKKDYSAAVSTLQPLINSGLYALQSTYLDLWHVGSDFCDEYMWEFNFDDADQANFENQGDDRAIRVTWRAENVTVPGGLGVSGFGGADYGKDFYDFMIAHDGKSNRYLGTIWDYEDILDRFIELGLAADRTEAMGEFWGAAPIMNNCRGYFRIKMVPWGPHPEIEGWVSDVYDWNDADNIHSKANWPGMRYSEVLLIYAEACLGAGTNTAEGLAALNEVRVRAGIDPLGSYDLQDVKDERRAELVSEGVRFQDLIRWGDAATETAGLASHTYTFEGYVEGTTDYLVTPTAVPEWEDFVVGRDELNPFPYNEMLLNPNIVQNPGW